MVQDSKLGPYGKKFNNTTKIVHQRKQQKGQALFQKYLIAQYLSDIFAGITADPSNTLQQRTPASHPYLQERSCGGSLGDREVSSLCNLKNHQTVWRIAMMYIFET